MKNQESIKKTLPKMMKYIVLIFVIFILPINILIQVNIQHKGQEESANERFMQVERMLDKNQENLKKMKDDLSKKSIMAAEMVAYFVEHNRGITSDLEWTKELAKKLDVDEIHYFTSEGKIYFGTHPEYYGYSFDSGEQMSFFKPMLKDKNLKLCQDIKSNTAEKKQMQYSAVWLKDKSQIVQIGLHPERVLKEIENRKLKNIFENTSFELRGGFHVYDKENKTIIASTSNELINLKIDDTPRKKLKDKNFFHYTFNNKKYCVYIKDYKSYILIRSYEHYHLLEAAVISSGIFLVYIAFISIVVMKIIKWYLDKKLVKNLTLLVNKLKEVEQGNLENIDIKTNIIEIDKLIFYINQFEKSIRSQWIKFSDIIDKGKISIGIYVYNSFYKKTFINERLFEILGIEKYENEDSLILAEKVRREIERAERDRVNFEKNIYRYEKNDKIVYLRIEKIEEEQSITYYITDVSIWYNEINSLRDKSNKDILTELYNRRGFIDSLDKIFSKPNELGYAVMILIDADNLKKINDTYGHNIGDKYLKKITGIISDRNDKFSISGRLGGDEFAIFIYGKTSLKELHEEIKSLKSRRGEIFAEEEKEIKEAIEFSMGYAFYPVDSQDYTLLVDIADEIMYQEKKERKVKKIKKNI